MWGKKLSYPKSQDQLADLKIDRPDFRFRQKETSSKRLKMVVVASVLKIILFAMVIGLLRLPELQVKEVVVEGGRSIDPAVVQKSVTDMLKGHFLWIIPRTNVLFVSKDQLSKKLRNQIPSLGRVSMEFRDRETLVVHVSEREPLFVWCANHETTDCYFVDDSGVLFERAPIFTPGVFVMIGGGKEIPGALSGSTPYTRDRLFHIKDITGLLLKNGFSPVRYDTTVDGDTIITVESYPEVAGIENFQIKTTEKTTPDLLTTMLSLVARDKDFVSTLNTHPGGLEYLDFRFPNKIIYKFKTGIDSAVAPQVP